jgi:hypothetical protein
VPIYLEGNKHIYLPVIPYLTNSIFFCINDRWASV